MKTAKEKQDPIVGLLWWDARITELETELNQLKNQLAELLE